MTVLALAQLGDLFLVLRLQKLLKPSCFPDGYLLAALLTPTGLPARFSNTHGMAARDLQEVYCLFE